MSEFFVESKPLKRLFLTHGEKVQFAKNQHLVWHRDKSAWVFFLAQGFVRASFATPGNADRIIGCFVPGAVFAQSGSFIAEHDEHLSYIAETPVQAYRMKQHAYLRFIREDPVLLQEYLALTLRNQIYLIDRIVYQGEKGLRKKCIRWLLFMAKYYGRKEGGACRIEVPLTQETIAKYLHATRESVNVELRALVEEGHIRIERKFVVIRNARKLRALVKHSPV